MTDSDDETLEWDLDHRDRWMDAHDGDEPGTDVDVVVEADEHAEHEARDDG